MSPKEQLRVEETNKWLKVFLENYGYKYTETIHIEYDGDTFCFRKRAKGILIHFQYHWEQEFDNIFWTGRLSAHHDFTPEDHFAHPNCMFEINNIRKRNIENLLDFEKKLLIMLIVLREI